MSGLKVHIDAAKSNRSLVAGAPAKRKQAANPVLKLWRWMINSAVADAKRTKFGLPTDGAIHARWWLEEHHPKPSDKDEWERSFAACCSWLDEDEDALRKKLLEEIETVLHNAYMDFLRAYVYQRRAAVLSCAGIPTAIAKHYMLPMVSQADYETIAGIEHGDPDKWELKLSRLIAA